MTTDILDAAEVWFPDCDGLPRWRMPDVHVRLNRACSHRTAPVARRRRAWRPFGASWERHRRLNKMPEIRESATGRVDRSG